MVNTTQSKKEGRILVVDDNISILNSLEQLLKFDFEEVKTLSNPNSLLNQVKTNKFDVVLLDMNFKVGINKGDEGLHWMKEILKTDADAVVILITAYADIELAVRAMKEGATDFVAKPWDPIKLIATLRSAVKLRKSRLEVKLLKEKEKGLNEEINRSSDAIIGESKAIKHVLELASRVAPTDANVLIVGENGTGKELIANYIHRLSQRCQYPFVSVDICSLSENLIESELFGHEKGAFTDAKMERAGRFEIASNGSLFLDEIGNIPFGLQAKLLTVLESRIFSRIGSNTQFKTNFRLISATNKNINQLITQKCFREDLFFRINTIQIEVPPLRDRPDDIPLLVEHFIEKYSKRYSKSNLKISNRTLEKLAHHKWPGNIRELSHAVERAVILCDTTTLKPEDFPFKSQMMQSSNQFDTYSLSEIERQILIKVISLSQGNLSKASKMLEISRTTLYSKIQKYGL
jgi:DNA-binding NtrC family response regulator